jgi:hypothetical protein
MALREKKKEKKLSGKVPRLDLSKVKNDSDEDSSEEEEKESEEKMLEGGTMVNNQSYNQYLKYLENQSQNNEEMMGEES